MGQLFYNISIHFLLILARVASLFSKKTSIFFKGRNKLFQNLERAFAKNTSPVAWFHCASLGEFEQGRPVIEAFRSTFPAYKILLTFFSPSGYEIRKNYEHADYVAYIPVDTISNARRFLSIVNPAIVFFIKYEFWVNFISVIDQRNIPLIGFSMIFRKGTIFFKKYGGFFRQVLHKFDHLFVQDENSYKLLQGIGVKHASVGGDTRFDRVYQICSQPKQIDEAEAMYKEQAVMVLGSTWPSDMDVLYDTINDTTIPLRYIIAPHNINRGELDHLEHKIKRKTVRFSAASLTRMHEIEVLIIDNIGMLSSLYQYGSIAYIGGAFRKALHNTLEAATFGLPVLFGDDETNQKFKEAIALVNQNGAIALPHQAPQVKEAIVSLIGDKEKMKKMGANAATYVQSNIGGSQKVINFSQKILQSSE